MGPQHTLGGAVKPLGWLLNASSQPVGGSGVTVAAMSYNSSTGLVSSSGVWRQVVDLGDLSRSGDVVIPGQSGHFLSPWYTSQQDLHMQGQLHPQLFTPEAYRSGKKLVLHP
jgi:penicillin G amidase